MSFIKPSTNNSCFFIACSVIFLRSFFVFLFPSSCLYFITRCVFSFICITNNGLNSQINILSKWKNRIQWLLFQNQHKKAAKKKLVLNEKNIKQMTRRREVTNVVWSLLVKTDQKTKRKQENRPNRWFRTLFLACFTSLMTNQPQRRLV